MRDRIVDPESIERVETPAELEAMLAAFDRWNAERSDLEAWQAMASALGDTRRDRRPTGRPPGLGEWLA